MTKKNHPLLYMSIAVVLLVAYAAADFLWEKKQDEKKEAAAKLSAMDKDQLNEIEIQRNGPNQVNEIVRLKKEGSDWRILQPVDEIADQKAVTDFVEALVLEKSNQEVKAGESIDWKIYGLDTPKGKVTVKDARGNSEAFEVSAQKNYMNDPYLRKLGVNKVFLASASWDARINKKAYDFRDKRLGYFSLTDVRSYHFQLPTGEFHLEKKDQKWIYPKNADWKMDQTRINELGSILSMTTVAEFVVEKNPSKEELKKFGLERPFLKASLDLGEGKKWRADFAISETKDYYVRNYDSDRIVKIAIADGEKFYRMNLTYFRNRKEPFEYPKELISQVEVLAADQKPEFELSNDTWKLKKDLPGIEAHPDKVKSLVSQLRNLEATDFAPESAKEKFTEILRLKDNEGKNLVEVYQGKTLKKKVDGKEVSLVLMKTNLYQDPVVVEEASLKRLGLNEVVTKKDMVQK